MAQIGFSRSLAGGTLEWAAACRAVSDTPLSAHAADLPGQDGFVDATVSVLSGVASTVVAVALPVRSPLQTANAIAAVVQASAGRVRVGFGAGNPRSIGAGHGLPFDKPGTRLMDFVSAVQQVLRAPRGAPVRFESAHYKLATTGLDCSASSAPLLVGAHGSRLTDFAADSTQGLITHLFTAESVARQSIAKARARRVSAGATDPFWTARGVLSAVHPDEEVALLHARWELAAGLRVWESRLAEVASPDLCEAVHDHLSRDAYVELAALLPEDLVRQFILVATDSDLVARLKADDSADEVVPVPVGTYYGQIQAFRANPAGPEEQRRRLSNALLGGPGGLRHVSGV